MTTSSGIHREFILIKFPESAKNFNFRGFPSQNRVMLSARNTEEIKFGSKFGSFLKKSEN
jgi:hypothetical protein